MKRALALMALATALSAALAQSSGGDFEVPRSVVAAGGGSSSGGVFELSGSLGQAVVQAGSSGGTFVISAGFWTGAETGTFKDAIFADGFEVPAD